MWDEGGNSCGEWVRPDFWLFWLCQDRGKIKWVCLYICQNPREAISEDIPNFTCISVYVCIYGGIYLCIYARHASWPKEKRYRPEIWRTYSHWPYLRTGFFVFFEKIPVTAASPEKLPCHVDFWHNYILDCLVCVFFCPFNFPPVFYAIFFRITIQVGQTLKKK